MGSFLIVAKYFLRFDVINDVNQDSNILEVKNLSVSFDGRTVVENVSYSLRRGCTLGIVGESGSGKSVSSLALMGLLPKNARVDGSAVLDGETELIGLDEAALRNVRGSRISMIFQEPMTSLNPVHRCGEQVLEMLRLHKKVSYEEARKRVLSLFEEVLLPRPEKIFESYPHELSGGQKQRVMIAMALVCEPELVIADEPTTALDVTVQKTILELLRELQRKRGISVIFITHDLGVIAQIADDVAVMYHGEIVERGSAEQVLHHPCHPYTQGLLACRPPLDGRPRRLRTVADFMKQEGMEDAYPAGSMPLGMDAAATDSTAIDGGGALAGDDVSDNARAEADHAAVADASAGAGRVPLLSVRNLNVEYTLKKNIFGKSLKTLKAVDGMSFDVYRGETLGLVGESGCGKTTLGRAILQLARNTSGSVSYDGHRLDTLSAREMRKLRTRMQIIFQDPYSSLNPRMTVGQAIMEPLRTFGMGGNDGERRKRVTELMERVGLKEEWFDRYPHEFSGGQRQRVCIARALVVEPELVICDESVSALDVSVQAQVLNLLKELKEVYGYTYIFISHDLSVVRYISDRILVMRQGRLVELGVADEVFYHPQEEYTSELIAAVPRID